MKKEFQPQWYLVLLTLAASVAGFFLRRGQLASELQMDGSLAEGSYLHIILALVTVLVLVGVALLVLPLPKKENWSQVFTRHPLPNTLQILSAGGLVCGNVVLWVQERQPITALTTQTTALSDTLSALVPLLGLLCAACIAVFAALCLMERRPSPLLYMMASIYLVVRLIVRFQAWNTDPSIYDYCFQLLAAISCMLAAFQLAGFSFDRGRRRLSLYWCLCAVVFSSINIADTAMRGTLDEGLINFFLLLSMAVSAGQLLFCKKD